MNHFDAIIRGNYFGLEFAQICQRLVAAVTVTEKSQVW
jgi:hypothetical protein